MMYSACICPFFAEDRASYNVVDMFYSVYGFTRSYSLIIICEGEIIATAYGCCKSSSLFPRKCKAVIVRKRISYFVIGLETLDFHQDSQIGNLGGLCFLTVQLFKTEQIHFINIRFDSFNKSLVRNFCAFGNHFFAELVFNNNSFRSHHIFFYLTSNQ